MVLWVQMGLETQCYTVPYLTLSLSLRLQRYETLSILCYKTCEKWCYFKATDCARALATQAEKAIYNRVFLHLQTYFVKRKGAFKRQFDNSKILFALSVSSDW